MYRISGQCSAGIREQAHTHTHGDYMLNYRALVTPNRLWNVCHLSYSLSLFCIFYFPSIACWFNEIYTIHMQITCCVCVFYWRCAWEIQSHMSLHVLVQIQFSSALRFRILSVGYNIFSLFFFWTGWLYLRFHFASFQIQLFGFSLFLQDFYCYSRTIVWCGSTKRVLCTFCIGFNPQSYSRHCIRYSQNGKRVSGLRSRKKCVYWQNISLKQCNVWLFRHCQSYSFNRI